MTADRSITMPPLHGRAEDRSVRTPLVPISLSPTGPMIWCKLEYLNPSGSTKDRIAQFILAKALRSGEIRPDDWIVEASSGSTSIALALACAQFGLRFLAVMPEGVSQERLLIIRGYGGEVIFTPRRDGITAAIQRAEEEAKRRQGFLTHQFSNADNPQAHRTQTACEILGQIPGGCVDAVVSGVGTGGTLVGLWRGFRDHGCSTRPFAARPVVGTSVVEVECCSFSGRIPGVVDGLSRIYAEAEWTNLQEVDVADDLALDVARRLIRQGFPVGPSSGLNYQAAVEASRTLRPGAKVVTVFPDRMERYFSTELFQSWS